MGVENIYLKKRNQKRGQKRLVQYDNALLMSFLFATPACIQGVFISFTLSQFCCIYFRRNKLGSMLMQEYYKGQKSSKITKCHFFLSLRNQNSLIDWSLFNVTTSTHGVLRVQGQTLITNLATFMSLCGHVTMLF